ncbi:hypothetical protein BJ878DRAFT_483209 [Calycina marina]|uniref:Uncharacterized protein n=1 Tax=Calycina marina TaxID=1763456 RepID=A0A9P7YW81_9HELO|nr:hypothetical protein BJ878DRAFT_483209 [Calycina marina]
MCRGSLGRLGADVYPSGSSVGCSKALLRSEIGVGGQSATPLGLGIGWRGFVEWEMVQSREGDCYSDDAVVTFLKEYIRLAEEAGARYDDENIVQRPAVREVRFHFAGWINWNAKCEQLVFYNDDVYKEVTPAYPSKPWRPPKTETETEEKYHKRVRIWDASRPHKREVTVQRNSMTQKYYTEKLLRTYIDAVHPLRAHDSVTPGEEGPWASN